MIDSAADRRWAEALVAENTLIAPELCSSRPPACCVGSNALARYPSAHRDLLRLDPELFPFGPFADRVWEMRNNLTCYDAWYVALAEAVG